MKAPIRKAQQCVVNVDHEYFVLPKNDALKLVDLLCKAQRAERLWMSGNGEPGYKLKDTPNVELTLLKEGDLAVN